MKRRKDIHIRIDDDVLEKFKRMVLEKYGKLHGALWVEVQNAMAHWIAEQTPQSNGRERNFKLNPGIPRTQLKIDEILKYLRGKGFTNQFTRKDWEDAVINTIGSDEKTVRKYLRLAEKLGRIKHYIGEVWEIV